MNREVIRFIIDVVLVIIIAVLMSTTCSYSRKLSVAKENITAMNDTMHVIKTENNGLIVYKQAYIAKSSEYDEYMNVTSKQIKELEKKLQSKLTETIVVDGGVRVDTIYMSSDVTKHGDTTNVSFGYDDKWMKIGGEVAIYDSTAAETKIDSLRMSIPLIVGFTKDDKCFATTECPYVSFSSVSGAMEQPHDKTGAFVGVMFGVGPQLGYDPISRRLCFSVGLNATVGIGYGFKINKRK